MIRFSLFPKTATDYFRRIFNTVVEQRGGWIAEAGQKDLLDALMKIKQEAIKNKEGTYPVSPIDMNEGRFYVGFHLLIQLLSAKSNPFANCLNTIFNRCNLKYFSRGVG